DEPLVHHLGHGGILEGLALHDVAPVTGRVADRDEQRAVELAGERQGLLAPRPPLHRVVLVLQQVRRRLLGERVGHGVTVIFLLPCPHTARPSPHWTPPPRSGPTRTPSRATACCS